MKIWNKIKEIFDSVNDWRIEARHYPAYLILERLVRVSVFSGLTVVISYLWSSPEITLRVINLSLTAGFAAGIDKFANKYNELRRVYDISRFETLILLFTRDDSYE